jgi:hypothetical protein
MNLSLEKSQPSNEENPHFDCALVRYECRIHNSLLQFRILIGLLRPSKESQVFAMELVQTVNEFDNLIAQVVDETIKYCLGEVNASVIYNYLEERNLPLSEIPKKPELFSAELRNILGFGSRQILCAASVLEETVLELLCKKLEIKLEYQKPVNFPLQLKKLREPYLSGGIRR